MPLTYFETDSLKKLSDKELVKNHQILQEKISRAQRTSTPKDIMIQMLMFEKAYTNEIDRRIDEDIIDLDEVEEEIYNDELNEIR